MPQLSEAPLAGLFVDGKGRVVEDLFAYVKNWLKHHARGQVFIGSDSKVRGPMVKYATVVCLWDVGHGVTELHRNEILPKPHDAFSRLWGEVTRAVETADTLRGVGQITVHIDINANPRFRSHSLYDASIGLITSMGFSAQGKPHSWAASCGAHRHCQ